MKQGLIAAAVMALGLSLPAAGHSGMTKTVLTFADLEGWNSDNHAAALSVFRNTCKLMDGDVWKAVCEGAGGAKDAKAFFETSFAPVLIEDDRKALFTGYYEPELPGSRTRTGVFQYPIYKLPPEVKRGSPWLTRAQIEGDNALAGRGLELAWLADPVEAFFLHVQGSGRLRLPDGSAMRVGFGGKNGHKYRSVGKEMSRLGLLPDNRLSAGAIKTWVRNNPDVGRKVLWHNPSFVFFREIKGVSDTTGPIGAMNRPVSAMRSIAVDPAYTPLGAPVWIEKGGKSPILRLMVAQDTGSAIKGAQRADIFFGSGRSAGDLAGVVRDTGRMIVLLPKALVSGG